MIINYNYIDNYQIIDGENYLIYNTGSMVTVHIRGIPSYTKNNSDISYTKNNSDISYIKNKSNISYT
jgi:hypothetical protein